MSEGLLKRIQECLIRRDLYINELADFMQRNGMKYSIPYIDAFAEPDDIRLIADFLQVDHSYLFEETKFTDQFVRSVFEETWPRYKSRLKVNKNTAWMKVLEGREFKGEGAGSAIRRDVELVLEGLSSPSTSMYGCQYPDCDCESRLHCSVTGWLIGPEG